jgi:hypothetical protein
MYGIHPYKSDISEYFFDPHPHPWVGFLYPDFRL